MMDYKQKYEDLLAEFEQYKKESVKWGVEDFLSYDHPCYTITREQAELALEAMIDDHDCNYGICWDTVGDYIIKYGEGKL